MDKAIGSMVAQRFTDWELLLINNASDAADLDRARRWEGADVRIRMIHESRKGIAHALNTGLTEARGSLIARMDADDVSQAHRLQKQVGFLADHPDHGVVSTQCALPPAGGSRDNTGYRLFIQWQNRIITSEEHALSRFIESPLAHPSVMFRRELIDQYGPYHTGPLPEDYELWLRWMEQGVLFYKWPEKLLQWNDPPDRLSRCHPNYSREAFFTLKCQYLARYILQATDPEKKLVICGSSKIGRKRAALLSALGMSVYGFTDVVERRNRQIRFIPLKELLDPSPWLVLNFIGKRGVGEAIRRHFTALGFVMGRDFIPAA